VRVLFGRPLDRLPGGVAPVYFRHTDHLDHLDGGGRVRMFCALGPGSFSLKGGQGEGTAASRLAAVAHCVPGMLCI
jgi:hypothetical protein